ncbi:phosphotransferase, partial [Pseudonocardia eucalypti]|uniref:phosphotransferase n=1 Tax=Pseudonocardia eucalypti TaxID=648755 RepID=UPI0031EA7FDD
PDTTDWLARLHAEGLLIEDHFHEARTGTVGHWLPAHADMLVEHLNPATGIPHPTGYQTLLTALLAALAAGKDGWPDARQLLETMRGTPDSPLFDTDTAPARFAVWELLLVIGRHLGRTNRQLTALLPIGYTALSSRLTWLQAHGLVTRTERRGGVEQRIALSRQGGRLLGELRRLHVVPDRDYQARLRGVAEALGRARALGAQRAARALHDSLARLFSDRAGVPRTLAELMTAIVLRPRSLDEFAVRLPGADPVAEWLELLAWLGFVRLETDEVIPTPEAFALLRARVSPGWSRLRPSASERLWAVVEEYGPLDSGKSAAPLIDEANRLRDAGLLPVTPRGPAELVPLPELARRAELAHRAELARQAKPVSPGHVVTRRGLALLRALLEPKFIAELTNLGLAGELPALRRAGLVEHELVAGRSGNEVRARYSLTDLGRDVLAGARPPGGAPHSGAVIRGERPGELAAFEEILSELLAHGLVHRGFVELPLVGPVVATLERAGLADLPERLVGFFWAEHDLVVIFTPQLERLWATGLLERLLAHEDFFHRRGNEHRRNEHGLTHDADAAAILALLSPPLMLARAVRGHPGATAAELSEIAGIDPGAVSTWLDRLNREGLLIELLWQGRGAETVGYWLPTHSHLLIEHLNPMAGIPHSIVYRALLATLRRGLAEGETGWPGARALLETLRRTYDSPLFGLDRKPAEFATAELLLVVADHPGQTLRELTTRIPVKYDWLAVWMAELRDQDLVTRDRRSGRNAYTFTLAEQGQRLFDELRVLHLFERWEHRELLRRVFHAMAEVRRGRSHLQLSLVELREAWGYAFTAPSAEPESAAAAEPARSEDGGTDTEPDAYLLADLFTDLVLRPSSAGDLLTMARRGGRRVDADALYMWLGLLEHAGYLEARGDRLAFRREVRPLLRARHKGGVTSAERLPAANRLWAALDEHGALDLAKPVRRVLAVLGEVRPGGAAPPGRDSLGDLLVTLAKHPGRTRGELVGLVGTDQATLDGWLAWLDTAGLIVRAGSPTTYRLAGDTARWLFKSATVRAQGVEAWRALTALSNLLNAAFGPLTAPAADRASVKISTLRAASSAEPVIVAPPAPVKSGTAPVTPRALMSALKEPRFLAELYVRTGLERLELVGRLRRLMRLGLVQTSATRFAATGRVIPRYVLSALGRAVLTTPAEDELWTVSALDEAPELARFTDLIWTFLETNPSAWAAVHRTAVERREGAVTGLRHANVRMHLAGRSVTVRTALPGAPDIEPIFWPEADVLAAVADRVPWALRLLHAAPSRLGRGPPEFLVLEGVDGELVADLDPLDERTGATVRDAVVRTMVVLTGFPTEALNAPPARWRFGAWDTVGFAEAWLAHLRSVLDRHRRNPAYRRLYRRLGVPEDPLARVTAAAPALRARLLALLHGDLNPGNLIIDAAGRVWVLDWELVLWGDVLLDLARYLNRTPLTASRRADFLHRWASKMPAEHIAGWQADLPFYEEVEHLQLALLNLPRHVEDFRAAQFGGTPHTAEAVVDAVYEEITRAHPHWPDGRAPIRDEVRDALRECAAALGGAS